MMDVAAFQLLTRILVVAFIFVMFLVFSICLAMEFFKGVKVAIFSFFGSTCVVLGLIGLMIRLFYSDASDVGFTLSNVFYGMGLFFFILYTIALKGLDILQWSRLSLASSSLLLLTVNAVIHVFIVPRRIFPFMLVPVFTLAILILLVMMDPFRFLIKELRADKNPMNAIELGGFCLVLIAGLGYLLRQALDPKHAFQAPLEFLSTVCGLVGVSVVVLIYISHRHYLYRIPYNIYYVLGYHDSGMLFYFGVLRPLSPQILSIRQEIQLIGSVMSAIDAIFRHALHEEMFKLFSVGKRLQLLLHRDPRKRVGYVIVADRLSWYLEQGLKYVLDHTPEEFFREGAPLVLDSVEIHQVVDPLLRRVFPFFEVEMKSTVISGQSSRDV